MIVSMLMIFAAPAWSAEVLHSVQCQQGEISDEELVAPSFAEWGEFMDNYSGSEAEAMDEKHGAKLSCGNGTLWETVLVE